jgi:hypothetical protein
MAWAQAYPTRPVRIILGQTAGGGQDIFTRLIAQWLSGRLGQQFDHDIVAYATPAKNLSELIACLKANPTGRRREFPQPVADS